MAGTNSGNAQDAPANDSQVQDTTTTGPQDGTNPQTDDTNKQGSLTLEQARALRAENARRNAENKELAQKIKDFEDAQKSDQQKATEAAETERKRADALEARLNDLTRKAAITAAISGTALYPDLIADKISQADVPIDPATNAPDAKRLAAKIAELRMQYPALFKPADQAQDAGANGKATDGGDMNARLRQAFGRSS